MVSWSLGVLEDSLASSGSLWSLLFSISSLWNVEEAGDRGVYRKFAILI